jgi:serine/threonine-protein kinase
MTFGPGTRLGTYEIVSPLGAGGMGEVYRARDTKLARDVALKFLPEAFIRDPGRLARFEREARTLAAMNHPHIAQIYGVDESNNVQALVLELVEGPTLADRLALGSIPIDEAFPIAQQIAEALEAAHDQAIVHRDLKPANIKIRPDGVVKVLDFGLAKALTPEGTGSDLLDSPTASPTIMTRAGVILGTAAYMSPEQARGRPVDKRTDIWAFGCVLYEMLTGRCLFGRENLTDTLAAIVHDGLSLEKLPANTPERVRVLVKRCLERDPRQRLRDIGEARIAIEGAQRKSDAEDVTPPGGLKSWLRRFAMIGLPVAAILVLVGSWRLRTRTPAPIAYLDVTLPDGDRFDSRIPVLISPDGQSLVYKAFRNERPQLFLRAMSDAEARPLPGTFDGEMSFFSPDGRWVGFFAPGKLQKVARAGGAPITLAPTSESGSATWAADRTIVFATAAGLFRIAESGGTAEPLTAARGERGERIMWPEVLPDGRAIVFGTLSNDIATFDDARIEVLSLSNGNRKTLIERGRDPHYVRSGHLLFSRGGDVLAVPFDASRLEVRGDPARVLTAVAGAAGGEAQFSTSDTGTLVFVPGPPDLNDTTLVLVDRRGVSESIGAPPRRYVHPRVSPDGRQIVVETRDATHTVWVYDLIRRTLTRVSAGDTRHSPDWMPDGRHVTFSNGQLFRQVIDGSAAEESVIKTNETADQVFGSGSWSPDGKWFVFTRSGPGRADIWAFAPGREPGLIPILRTSFEESSSALSPDGQWLAYVSDESGREEVYVQSFPRSGGKHQISTAGGTEPVWARNGREIFYRNPDGALFTVAVTMTPSFVASRPDRLFDKTDAKSTNFAADYDVMPDGRFLMLKESESPKPVTRVRVVLNWFQELERLAPARPNF